MNKLLKNIMIIFSFSSLLVSCVSLNTEPTDRIINSYFWKTENDAVMAVNGVYNSIPGIDYMYLDCATDLAWNEISWGPAHLLGNGSQDAGAVWSWGENKWKDSYCTIQRANYVVENIDKVEDIDVKLKNRLLSEVRFIRAMTFADLMFLYGDVPLTLTTLDLKNCNIERTSKDKIYAFVTTELMDIIDNHYLPVKYDNSADVGRVTEGAAKALLMRIYLRENDFEKTKSIALDIINDDNYKLYGDYEKLFKYDGENCCEIIFDKQYIPTTNNNDISKILSPRSCFGTSEIVPLASLVDAYETINGKPIDEDVDYDPRNPYENRDPRLKATILVPGGIMPNGEVFKPYPDQNPVGTDAVDNGNVNTSRTGFHFLKYVNPEDLSESNTNCHNNVIFIRYAEVLLSYAEAKIETNDIDKSVYDAINKVRNRVGMPPIQENKSKDELREILRHERMVEFPLEGIRYFDIRRWKIAEKIIPGQTYGMTYINKEGNIDKIKTSEFRKFNPARDYLWPIPARERHVNPNLTQNPLY